MVSRRLLIAAILIASVQAIPKIKVPPLPNVPKDLNVPNLPIDQKWNDQIWNEQIWQPETEPVGTGTGKKECQSNVTVPALNEASAKQAVSRLLCNAYNDGISKPRSIGKGNTALPSPRAISDAINIQMTEPTIWSQLLVFFGQFFDHEVTLTPTFKGPNDTSIKCCEENGDFPSVPKHPECLPILVAKNDSTFNKTCLEFVRALAAKDDKGEEIKPRIQKNDNTPHIDLSPLYGSSTELMNKLREFKGGRMKSQRVGKGWDYFLPKNEKGRCTTRPGTDQFCPLAGDDRVTENSVLFTLHILFLREHNRIADKIAKENTNLCDEEIFILARKIMIATFQNIVYSEYLPSIVGFDRTLSCEKGRSPHLNFIQVKTVLEFVVAAFRFGHSTVPHTVQIGPDRVPLTNLFNNAGIVYDQMDAILEGVMGINNNLTMEQVDRFFAPDLTKTLFGRQGDLVSLNIQRGRDTGLPPYYKLRRACGGPELTGFNDPALGTCAGKLQKVYKSVKDIDAFVGLTCEALLSPNIAVGPTIRCILLHQFFIFKYGDPDFFDNWNMNFNDEQIKEIRKNNFRRIICRHTKIKFVPSSPFLTPSQQFNPLIPCLDVLSYGLNIKKFI